MSDDDNDTGCHGCDEGNHGVQKNDRCVCCGRLVPRMQEPAK